MTSPDPMERAADRIATADPVQVLRLPKAMRKKSKGEQKPGVTGG